MKELINCYDAKSPALILHTYIRRLCPLLSSIQSFHAMSLYTIMFAYNATVDTLTPDATVTVAAITMDAYILLNDLPRHKFHILKRLSGK